MEETSDFQSSVSAATRTLRRQPSWARPTHIFRTEMSVSPIKVSPRDGIALLVRVNGLYVSAHADPVRITQQSLVQLSGR